MKIKLILSASKTDPLRGRDPFMPLSLPLIAACAPNHSYTLIDMLMNDDPKIDEPADLIGISVRTTAQHEAYRIADEFRKRQIPVVLGGPHVTALPFQAIQHADAVACGEGEPLWPHIVADAFNKQLKSFYVCSPEPFNGQGKSVFQIDRYPSLDEIPFPNRQFNRKRYIFDTVFASRGCPIKCDFCSVSPLFGTTTRHRPVEKVADEIDTLGKYFYLIDDTVFGRHATWDYYLDLYQRISRHKKHRFWTGQIGLDAASNLKGREVIKAAAGAGLVYAAAGIESVNPDVLLQSGAIRKSGVGSTEKVLDKIRDNILFIQKQGIVMSGWFVIGYEGDTIETYWKTWEFCREMNLIPVIFPVRALPGTPLYKRALKQGLISDSSDMLMKNKNISNIEIRNSLDRIQNEGFSWPAILSRTAYYSRWFSTYRIHKTIFSIALQRKMKNGLFHRNLLV